METHDSEEAESTAMVTRAKVRSAMESRQHSACVLTEMKDNIQPMLSVLPPDVEAVRAEHSRWLQEYETLLIHHRAYLALVEKDQRATVEAGLYPEGHTRSVAGVPYSYARQGRHQVR